jgi:hypothetical protein
LLLIIFDYLTENSDLLTCGLVCKRWLGIVEKRTQLNINQTIFDLINNSTHQLYRQPKNLSLSKVQFELVTADFAQILQNCQKVFIHFCTFTTSEALKTVLLSCKNLNLLQIDRCKFAKGVIEPIIANEQLETFENAVIGRFSWLLLDYKTGWKLIKTFKALGIQLNVLDLGLYTEDFSMKMIEYIKETYGTKLKHLDFNPSLIKSVVCKFLQFIIDWNELKLESFSYYGSELYGIIENLVEKQTNLKKLDCTDEINIEKCPISLNHLSLMADDMNSLTINNICRFRDLKYLSLHFMSAGAEKLNLTVLSQMVQLEKVTISIELAWNEKKVELELEDLCLLRKMKNLSLQNMVISYQVMQSIIKNMPNLECLKLLQTDGVSKKKSIKFSLKKKEKSVINKQNYQMLYLL